MAIILAITDTRLIEFLPLSFNGTYTSNFSDNVEAKRCFIARHVSQLPPIEQARELLDQFASVLHPSISILHIPSERLVVENTYRTLIKGQEPTSTSLLLLFTVFAGAAQFWTPKLLERLDATRENAEIASETYINIALSIVENAHRRIEPSTTALASILTLAHIVLDWDDSSVVSAVILRSQCLSMARAMQVHRLDTPTSTEERRVKGVNTVDVEVQRRVWLSSFSGHPQEGVYAFHPTHMNVHHPCNSDDDFILPSETAIDFASSTPTTMSCFLQRIKMADVCRKITDEISPISNDSIKPDYQVVLGFDRELHELEEQLPGFFQLNPSKEQVELCKDRPYIAWQRLSVHLSLHARLCRLHRYYHLEGLSNPEYLHSRNACVHSAHKIIEIRRAMDDPALSSTYNPERVWVTIQHVSLAAFTLATDVSFNPVAPDAKSQKERVMVAYKTLDRSKKSLNGLISGIQRNIRAIMASSEKNNFGSAQELTGKEVTAFSNQTRPTNFILDGGSKEDPDDTLMSDGRWEESHELWTEFLATVPDLKKFEWSSLLDDVDLDPSHLFQ
ncbi:unnamed protein product [Clonostachys rosea]|uniref:Xylanolytic transcriptional activator regulatory domain-containing protein n=1 Tax=Bionectria ochroleuca TaxID=29856 RepID=A0ABY6UNC7_BIOOC|nr:unnamed protein product [Clonostachys rosea]